MSERTLIAPAPGIFRYPGGKTKTAVRQWILGFCPAGTREYREPFVGGGGVFWGMTKAERFWINDINPGLVAVYQALADRPEEFIARCREIEPARPDDPLTEPGKNGGGITNARLKAIFERIAFDESEDPALRFFFVNRTVFAGRVNYDIPSRLYFSNPSGWDIVKNGSLAKAAKKLRCVRVTCGDFVPLLEEPGEHVWVYCDPPYVVNTGMTPSSQLYQFGFSEDDHKRFAATVKASPHKVAVSYDDDEQGFIRSLYEGMHIEENTWAYCGTTNEEKEEGRELLILNYDPPRNLVTYVFNDEPETPADDGVELLELESRVERFRLSFVDAGLALQAIRDRRLYKSNHKTFEGYCKERWGIISAHARRLIEAAVVVGELKNAPIGAFPQSESQARELTRLEDPNDRVSAWSAAVHATPEGKAVTAKIVREQVNALLPPRPDPPGWREKLVRLWNSIPAREREAATDFVCQLMEASQ